MTAVSTDVLQWGWERARTGPWRGDGTVAYLAPLAPAGTPSVDFLNRCLDTLAGRGYREVVTSALAPSEQGAFFTVGFEPHERLHLLAHDLRDLPKARSAGGERLRRGRSSDWPEVLAVDTAAFSPFWRLDPRGLSEAIDATPASRFRVATSGRGPVLGYAVTGSSGTQGYLQRLAVDPGHRRAGLGRALALDGLRWLGRRGVAGAVVNTQLGNEAALGLYLSLGFRRQAMELAVLHRRLG